MDRRIQKRLSALTNWRNSCGERLSAVVPSRQRVLGILLITAMSEDRSNGYAIAANHVSLQHAMGRSAAEVKKAFGAIGNRCGVKLVKMLECIVQE